MRIATAAAALALAIPAVAYAHHGWSSYDASRPMVVTGPVVSSTYGNPHGSLEIRHEGALWSVVLAPPSRMTARGLSADMIAEGREVTVEGYPRRDGTPEIRAERITADGKTVELR
ncbi:DUF6152 family protein [Tistrella mobilis]|jgi:hypothetical protein|uniref:DUF6152 family protein n=1 Tax=Tistrella mobilis TaxID=171437 RepID=UPI0035573F34